MFLKSVSRNTLLIILKAHPYLGAGAGKIDRLPGASGAELLVAVAGPECHLSPVG